MNILTKFPLGQYIAGNKSWLRIIDSRLKLIILSIFLITPIWAGPLWRVSLVVFLMIITFVSFLPLRIWRRQFLFLILLSLLIGLLSIFASSNLSPLELSSRDPDELEILLKNTSWNIFEIPIFKLGFIKLGPYNVSRKALELGIKTSTLIFTVIHSVNLVLLTTLKEEIVWALSWYFNPLRRLNIPVDRWLFQLLLAMRFIPLVQEEFENILKSLSVRSLNYRNLGFKNSFKVLLNLIERLFLNILLRIEQGSESLLSKSSLQIKTNRFKPSYKQKFSNFFINSLSVFFIFLAIFLRKQYGAL
tara:strand:- start:9196 stop:10107 length:912 start_codon:yes stop_codon:yes gene_type:complete